MQIIEQYITNNDCYKSNKLVADYRYAQFQRTGPTKLMLHSVGTSQPDAYVFARRWNQPGLEVAVHAVLQNDGVVLQTLPWNYRGWHAGGSANNTAIGVEMTEPATIHYIPNAGDKFTVSDIVAAKAHVVGCYKTAVDLFAFLCDMWGIDPITGILSHREGAKAGVASNHSDPEHLWRGLEMSYTMDGFRNDVKKKLIAIQTNQKEDEDLNAKEVTDIVKKELDARDPYIETFADLPEWAKPEIRELIEIGALKGVSEVDKLEDTQIHAGLNTYIRPIIVAWRTVKKMTPEAVTEAKIVETFKKILEKVFGDDGK